MLARNAGRRMSPISLGAIERSDAVRQYGPFRREGLLKRSL
jgi:hypothetical protein